MESLLAYSNTKPWGDMLYEDEQNRKMAYLRMPRAEWLACVNAYFNTLCGNGSALISALSWFVQMEAERERAQMPVAPVEVDEQTRNWRVWLDMVEEPEKYGSDIAEWLELDEELRRGPKRWRVDAYWNAKLAQMREDAIVKIQALWRGYQTREAVAERFNCGRCLTHTACFDRLSDDDMYVCPECKVEWDAAWKALGDELEAEEQTTCFDCENPVYGTIAQIGDNVYCQECAQLWAVCSGCEDVVLKHYVCPNHCRTCGEVLNDERKPTGFCSYECHLDHQDATRVCFDCGDEFVTRGTKVGDMYLCPGCVHEWEACDRCPAAKPRDGACDNHCRNCGESLENATTTLGYCSFDCQYEWQQDNVD